MKAIKAEEVKEFFRKRDIDFLGIAPVERFIHAPEGRRPTDLLPGAKSVIVIGMHILYAVGRAAKCAYDNPEMRHASYTHMLFGYTHLNRVMDVATHELARMLEGKGYITLPIPASAPNNVKELYGAFSNRHAAVAAGFGEFGWIGLLLVPQIGPRIRVASLITEAEIEPDPMYTGRQLCDPESCGYICAKVCHVGALSDRESVKLVIGEREFEYAKLNKRLCTFRDFSPYPPGTTVDIPNDPSDEDWLEIIRKYGDPWRAMEQASIGRGSPGCRCVYECPVGQDFSPIVKSY